MVNHEASLTRDLVDVERYRAVWRDAHGSFSLNMVMSSTATSVSAAARQDILQELPQDLHGLVGMSAAAQLEGWQAADGPREHPPAPEAAGIRLGVSQAGKELARSERSQRRCGPGTPRAKLHHAHQLDRTGRETKTRLPEIDFQLLHAASAAYGRRLPQLGRLPRRQEAKRLPANVQKVGDTG